MAKVKSVKFYNFEKLSNALYMTFNMKFYDYKNDLIIINVLPSELITYSGELCENTDYKITAYGTTHATPNGAFHTGNYEKNIGLGRTEYPTWSFSNTNSWIKIEFKIPKKISDMKISHSTYGPEYGFDTCCYNIEYDNGIIESGHYKSDGIVSPINWKDFYDGIYEQSILDDQFDSIEFNGKTITVYDTKVGYVETLDTNNFKNIPVNSIEKLKVIYTKPVNTLISCLVSFDQKQTWKTFNGNNWIEISDTSANNIILNCMDIEVLNSLDKNKLISGGFVGDLDFKIAMKTNDENKTPSVTKIYIEYK